MKIKLILTIICYFPLAALAEALYCPQNHGYINVGMTQEQVINACGEPLSKLDSTNTKIEKKVPVKQLLYLYLNQGSVFPTINGIYDTWSLPSGSEGLLMQIDVINNKVSSVRIDNSDNNAFSVCGGQPIVVGDDEIKVYNACGSPAMINNTFTIETIPDAKNPEVWIFQQDQFAPVTRLTFIDGILQFINK